MFVLWLSTSNCFCMAVSSFDINSSKRLINAIGRLKQPARSKILNSLLFFNILMFKL
jgi:hypothetical protein